MMGKIHILKRLIIFGVMTFFGIGLIVELCLPTAASNTGKPAETALPGGDYWLPERCIWF